MSELNDVPEDVLTSATEAARDVGQQLDAAHRRGSPGTAMAAYVIARAIMAERERCATMVERNPTLSIDCGLRAKRAAEDLAAAIRGPSLSGGER